MGRPAKALSVYADRGFKSHPLRHMSVVRPCARFRAAIAVFSIVFTAFVMAALPVDNNTAHAAQSCPQADLTYTVVRNDSWSRIADKVKVSMKSLLGANNATTKSMLLIGDVVCLPNDAVTAGKNVRDNKATNVLQLAEPERRFTAKKSRQIIREVFPRRLEERALAIAKRESRMNAAGYSWCCVGLFQLNWWSHREWLTNMGITSPQQLLDAKVNAEAALALYKRSGGWGPWE